jgi:hypothetical protein
MIKLNSNERMQAWRAKQTQQGGRNLSVWLDAEAWYMLDQIRKHFGRSTRGRNKPLIIAAIQHLYESIFSEEK